MVNIILLFPIKSDFVTHTKPKFYLCVYIDFISRGSILSNTVKLSYGPQTIKLQQNTTHNKLLKVKKSDPRSGVLTKNKYIYSTPL